MTVPFPTFALLSNGSYNVLVTGSGAGYSTWRGYDVTRWREDATRDCWGQFCYVRDLSNGKVWSVGRQPLFRPADAYDYDFAGDKAEFRRRSGDIETVWTICVAPDADVEVRVLAIVNHGKRARTLELTSYSEVSLNHRRADQAHPAFAKLFIETHFDGPTGALFARRRPRDSKEKPIWAVHVSASDQPARTPVEFETDRFAFIGRGRTAANPRIFDPDVSLSKTSGPVLDPVFCLRRSVHLSPGATARVAFSTGAADEQVDAHEIASQFSDFTAVDRACSDAFESHQQELSEFNLTPQRLALFNRLAGPVVFTHPSLREALAVQENRLGQSALWPFAISGDLPIVLVRMFDADEPLLRELMEWHAFSRRRGLKLDLVVVDEAGGDIARSETLTSEESAGLLGQSGGYFLLSAAELSQAQKTLIAAAARIVLRTGRGSLAEQLDSRPANEAASRPAPPAQRKAIPSSNDSASSAHDLLFWNGFGGFTPDGKEYVVEVDGTGRHGPALPPATWTNVIANQNFGCLATEAGLGYTWSGNSQMNRLTPWSNDPISDPPGEVVYLRDEASGEIWTPTPLPLGQRLLTRVHHGQGYTRYRVSGRNLQQELSVHVPPQDPVKILRLELRNDGSRARRLSATYFAEWVLGAQRDSAAMQVVCERDPESGAVVARNCWAGAFAEKIAFATTSHPVRSATADRTEFLGQYGSVSEPAGLACPNMADRFGPLLDPCAALTVDVVLPPGAADEIIFVLGQADSLEQVRQFVREHADRERSRQSLSAVCRQWDELLSAVQVSTPDLGFDLMMNRWLIYQILCCRVWARTSNYQSGGAYGFRDQLQDVMALVYSAPGETRAQILRAAARQFEEGDVQHWWHPPSGLGVRTRITDDLYFLPLVVHHYVLTTGDIGLLDEQAPFITSPVLQKDQDEDFRQPDVSDQSGTVYEHCVRALERGLRLGEHGLPLMGAGDWNDGMNKVGPDGKGESVWNGWFFLTVLKPFAVTASLHGDESRAAWCRERAEDLRKALEASAWDGEWYRRAYFDDGTPLGSSTNDECQIDAIPQAWAVMSGEADPERATKAMGAVHARLVREKEGLIKLLDPPFDKGSLQPGYIKGYVPGIRENGGQYTHAASWVVWATALQGDGDRALELWNLINPIHHAATKEQAERYKVEPYVVSADIYGAPPHVGRGGWTWYTGSASWLYRVALDAILGFKLRGSSLRLEPCMPKAWQSCELTYRHGATTYHIHFDNSARGARVLSVALDGSSLSDGTVPLSNDGQSHRVDVILG